MLLADKRELQNNLKVSLLQIEEKELNYYTTNCMTVGTQAAMLGGFAFAALMKVETADTHAGKSFVEIFREDALCFVWYISAVLGMLLETFALVKSMQLSILAPGLALRGSKEGSMTQALVTMRTEYHRVHMCFYSGLFCFLISVALFAVAFFTHVAAVRRHREKNPAHASPSAHSGACAHEAGSGCIMHACARACGPCCLACAALTMHTLWMGPQGYLSITVCFIIVSGVLWLYNDYRKV